MFVINIEVEYLFYVLIATKVKQLLYNDIISVILIALSSHISAFNYGPNSAKVNKRKAFLFNTKEPKKPILL